MKHSPCGRHKLMAIQYIQKKGIKHTKGQLNIKEDSNRGSEGQKNTMKHLEENRQQSSRSECLVGSNYFH